MITVYNDGFEEVESVSSKALEAVRIYGMNYSDVAILCRTNAELALYEQVFADKEIPVRLSSQGWSISLIVMMIWALDRLSMCLLDISRTLRWLS